MNALLVTRLTTFALALLAAGMVPAAPSPAPTPQARPWAAGAARIDVTPGYPVRLSGYGSRRTEHEAVEQHIFAKAIALGTDAEGPALLLTVDNCGVPGSIRTEVIRRLAGKTPLKPERVALCSSHTHSAPMLAGVLPNLFSTNIPPEHWARVERYTRELTDKLEQVALAALADRQPASLAFGFGHAAFAHNRRAFAFRPEDHSVPVLRVVGKDGKVIAILTSYACHCTTVAFNKVHGDWAGCAQEFLEREFPGSIALTAIGCGADQNPNPRGTYGQAQEYGNALGAEVRRVASGGMKALTGKLGCATRDIRLPFDKLPTRTEWETRAQDKAPNTAFHAQVQLAKLARGGKLPTELPYMVQVWNFGRELAMVFLPGEVVVDYGLRLKREYDAERLWVNGYANDVPCYIPSERVLFEGGYEGATAMLYYDRPTRFAPGVEERIIGAARKLMPGEFVRGK